MNEKIEVEQELIQTEYSEFLLRKQKKRKDLLLSEILVVHCGLVVYSGVFFSEILGLCTNSVCCFGMFHSQPIFPI